MSEVVAHPIEAIDGVQIFLYRVGTGNGTAPVLLVPGTFGDRYFWTGRRGAGFADALLDAGFDPWILEVRGHGRSDWDPESTIGAWIEHDAPAAVTEVLGQSGADALWWVGHSAGGVLGAAYSARNERSTQQIRGLVMLGSPGPTLSPWRKAGAALLRVAGRLAPEYRLPGRPMRLGPGHEPAGLVGDWMEWNSAGRWNDGSGGDYLARLGAMPTLAIAGAADHFLAPPEAVQDLLNRFPSEDRTLLVAGREHGFGRDYDHAGLMLGDGARAEIWPRVLAWLDERGERGQTLKAERLD